ncbi:MAG TPA: extracellular solute-binding protein [Phycisphaerales bacterium]|nr:extracellular solute-binding protein [Phycisphaerales bacterium]
MSPRDLISRTAIVLALALILGVPFLLRPKSEAQASSAGGSSGGAAPAASSLKLVVVTPHVPQIRSEFEKAFTRWHQRTHGQPVAIDWRVPGGTSDILTQLEAQYQSAVRTGQVDLSDPRNPKIEPGTIAFDLMFGGGSYDHGRVKAGVKGTLTNKDGTTTNYAVPMSEPAGFDPTRMTDWFGDNSVGAQLLYDNDQHWIGVALSGFGLVYNREMLADLNIPTPTRFDDLADPRLFGNVILADPRQSGSVATTLDSILSNYGWDRGWRLIREICANSRGFVNSAPKPPIDVSQGEAAAALAIDFYGRGQAQAIVPPGEDPSNSRVGYVDPAGATYIDADPISILRGGPNPALARRFVEFCLTEEAQALWQFRARPRADNPTGASGEEMGPEQYELRRMPARRVMYDKYKEHFIDQADPFEIASKTLPRGWRGGLGIMMGAFAIDNAHAQRDAWSALLKARATPTFPAATLAEMERLFYAFPPTTLPDGTTLEFTPDTFKQIEAAWKKSPQFRCRCEIEYTRWFRETYERVTALGSSN